MKFTFAEVAEISMFTSSCSRQPACAVCSVASWFFRSVHLPCSSAMPASRLQRSLRSSTTVALALCAAASAAAARSLCKSPRSSAA